MELIKYIFFLGIVFIIFSMIWGFFMILYRLLTGIQQRNSIERYIFKIANMYLLVSLSAMQTQEYLLLPGAPKSMITIVGLLVLYSYLTGRLERKRFIMQINNLKIDREELNMKFESFIIIASLVYFSFCITNPVITENPVNNWFYSAVKDIYATPVIGWIIGLIGVFFLIFMLIKSFMVTTGFIADFMERITGNKRKDDDNSSDDSYTDYEIIEDDKIK